MTVSTRPKKRQRTAPPDDRNHLPPVSSWDASLVALVERLDTIRTQAIALRDEHRKSISDIEEKIALRETASRATSRIPKPPPSDDVDVFSRGVRVKAQPPPPEPPDAQPVSAMTLLMESEPPEKIIHEQSIIVRAQAINRKNAELARERLPKQPEAQRNKTHQDYLLDEATWMAVDFREERKLKIQLAKKISRMISQYHTQRKRREARAEIEAHQRLVRLAGSIARGVRKFWSQVEEIAHFKTRLVEEAREERERQSQLKQLVERTDLYTKKVAKSLQTPSRDLQRKTDDVEVKQVTFTERNSGSDAAPVKHDPSLTGVAERNFEGNGSTTAAAQDGTPSGLEGNEVQEMDTETFEPGAAPGSDSEAEVDDETTLAAAEAECTDDPSEIRTLENQAAMGVEELLRSQGIDPAVYNADKKDYLDSMSNASERSEEEEDAMMSDDAMDDESTIHAAEAEESSDQEEEKRLQGDNSKSVNEVLRSQGIDPDAYHADNRKYLDTESELSEESHDELPSERESEENHTAATTGPPGNGNEPANGSNETRPKEYANDLAEDVQGRQQVKHRLAVVGSLNGTKTVERVSIPTQLLRGNLRDYQQAGMEWLVSLYKQSLNGILADEMGLGKTIQTIALLAWLALEKGIWGPHLIVVPTSVMVNWEVEFKKWLPGFKILTYFGSMKERKMKRHGWTKPNLFHVCITSYTLAVQDATVLRRKKWQYLILDEAHNIKNFESQRWQTLLSFSSERRLLITGTPLQNSVMELWSLMHFLTPDVFSSHSEFKGWFSKPLIEAAEAEGERSTDRAKVVANLHRVLRPFMLRRLKADVEKGLPPKSEHVVKCHLSKRQRQLYEDFMSRSDIRETLQSGDYIGVLNVLMQLRKVCNHPDLFEGRPIVSPFSMSAIFFPVPSSVPVALANISERLNLGLLNLDLRSNEQNWLGEWYTTEAARSCPASSMREKLSELDMEEKVLDKNTYLTAAAALATRRMFAFRRAALRQLTLVNALRIRQRALLGEDLRNILTLTPCSLKQSLQLNKSPHTSFFPRCGEQLCRTIDEVAHRARVASDRFVCCITKAVAPCVEMRYRGDDSFHRRDSEGLLKLTYAASAYRSLFRSYDVRSRVTTPDGRLIQWDCGKLQVLALLLRKLKTQDSRVLIFTQMTKVLDMLESFLNLHSYRYLRLDGTTKTDDRQKVVERFNTDKRIFCMILTTRAGGIGLNLTGANSVVFYDTDYNPAIDNQAQDRAHRIGQTKPVHIYRLVSEQTVEEKILERANEKRTLESLVISEAGFTTDAIKNREPLPNSVQEPQRAWHGAQVQVKSDLDTTAAVRNGLSRQQGENVPSLTGGPLNGELHKRFRGDGTRANATIPQVTMAIETAHGQFNGFSGDCNMKSNSGEGDVNSRTVVARDRGMDKYQEVTEELLANEDERERLALYTAEKEERELRAEFEDADLSEESSKREKRSLAERKKLQTDYAQIKSSLTPVQLYALRLVESWHYSDGDAFDERAFHDDFAKDRLSKGLVTDALVNGNAESSDHAEEEGIAMDKDTLSYEIDTTELGQESYLKVLTDADADIKLYLPLRDGGPEELKVSSVVSGTAAAGLECAEDAAFFPHAYNRMSRTPYATRRQREKGLANLRKRRAEKEAKRQREAQVAAVAAAAANALRKPESTVEARSRPLQVSGSVGAVEKQRSIKNKVDMHRASGMPQQKKTRTEGIPKAKGNPGTNNLMAQDATQSMSMGLFKRSTKKNARRLSLPGGKSSLASSSSGMPGDGLGINDGWTREEDQKLITCASEFNNNMFLVGDVLTSDPRVAAGLRRHRSSAHCIDRLINCLGKEKSGPPAVKAGLSDSDMLRKHQQALKQAVGRLQQKPPSWLVLHPPSSEAHPSHAKVIAQAAAKMKGTPKRDGIPPFKAVFVSHEVPKHHKAGFKPTETTPQALNKLRYPFVRPPKDDQRAWHQRGGGQPSRYNGAASAQGPLQRGDPTLFTKAASKATRGAQHPGLPRGSSNAQRAQSASKPDALPKGRTDGTSSKAQTNLSAAQHSSKQLPPAYNASRKGYFVPGTGGRISIGQYGNTVQNMQGAPAPVYATTKPGADNRKVPAFRMSTPVASLKPGVQSIPTATTPSVPGRLSPANGVTMGSIQRPAGPNAVPPGLQATSGHAPQVAKAGIPSKKFTNVPERGVPRPDPQKTVATSITKTASGITTGGRSGPAKLTNHAGADSGTKVTGRVGNVGNGSVRGVHVEPTGGRGSGVIEASRTKLESVHKAQPSASAGGQPLRKVTAGSPAGGTRPAVTGGSHATATAVVRRANVAGQIGGAAGAAPVSSVKTAPGNQRIEKAHQGNIGKSGPSAKGGQRHVDGDVPKR